MEQIKKRITSICYAAGNSGGHIIPCLTLAARLKQEQPQISVIFFSSNSSIDQTILKGNFLVDQHVPLALSHKRSLLRLPLICMHLLWATLKSFYLLRRYKPSRIISTGGIVAAPVSIAGFLLRIPIDLYELNAVPGKAIRALAPLASRIYVCFSSTKKYFPKKECAVTQYPVRFDQKIIPSALPDQFSPDRLTIFVQGGSQGSQIINRHIKKLIETYPKIRTTIQLIHQTGSDTSVDWNTFYEERKIPAHVFSYDHEMAPYYQHADLIICRSGAGALFEALFFQAPCITIPLETKHNTHQLDNAQAMVAEHPKLFTMIRQDENVVDKLYQTIKKVRS